MAALIHTAVSMNGAIIVFQTTLIFPLPENHQQRVVFVNLAGIYFATEIRTAVTTTTQMARWLRNTEGQLTFSNKTVISLLSQAYCKYFKKDEP